MCGITGIISYNSNVNQKELDSLTDALSHRGPDGRGTFIDNNVGLGHRRLSILDLSNAGQCPMKYKTIDGRTYWITYNGEIYNFLELRAELKQHGYHFNTETDTEVVLAGYAHWGKDCLLHFNGMWAFAIWDSYNHELFLARDRFGIKPLYYAFIKDRCIFASEYKVYLALDYFPFTMNSKIIPDLIKQCYRYEGQSNETIVNNVFRLPSGYSMSISQAGKVQLNKWWETMNHIPDIPTSYEDQIDQFRHLFFDSVRIRMRSDTPVGSSLSGGIDSSAVASSMAYIQKDQKEALERCHKNWQHTFIASFPGSKVDETMYADEVVQQIGARPHYWKYNENEVLSNICNSVWSTEDICLSLAVHIWLNYREMRRANIYVTLDGHGGDELLGGYPWHLNVPVNQVNQQLHSDFHFAILPTILRIYDRCSMAHGIEVRMPFMDWRLVTYSFGLPPETKLGGGFTKRIVRDAMKGVMPDSIIKRQSKIGYGLPMIEMFNGPMKDLLVKVMNHQIWLESPFWNGTQVRDFVLQKTLNKQWTYDEYGFIQQIWLLMNLVIWKLVFIENDITSIV